jgi:hypothetical protein
MSDNKNLSVLKTIKGMTLVNVTTFKGKNNPASLFKMSLNGKYYYFIYYYEYHNCITSDKWEMLSKSDYIMESYSVDGNKYILDDMTDTILSDFCCFTEDSPVGQLPVIILKFQDEDQDDIINYYICRQGEWKWTTKKEWLDHCDNIDGQVLNVNNLISYLRDFIIPLQQLNENIKSHSNVKESLIRLKKSVMYAKKMIEIYDEDYNNSKNIIPCDQGQENIDRLYIEFEVFYETLSDMEKEKDFESISINDFIKFLESIQLISPSPYISTCKTDS